MKLTKKTYLMGFLTVVLILACVRWAFPGVAEPRGGKPDDGNRDSSLNSPSLPAGDAIYTSSTSLSRPHRIFSVPSYAEAFPDTNALQLTAAQKWGVTPVANRADAEARKRELVYIGASPYYDVARLYSSIPYLVPRAAVLLNDIGRAFFDSLYVKGVPLHKIVVTSVLRSQEDVVKLRRHNGNATENSCHLYGTTFDISYTHYKTVEDPEGPHRREVQNDTLLWVLSEVMRDMRKQQRCYVKYERKQACFHATVR